MKYLIVDDHPMLVEALKLGLGSTHQYVVAGSLGDALARVKEHSDIDLILYDLDLPDSKGVGGLMRLRTAMPSVPIMVLSASTDRNDIQQASKLGAAGFVSKSTDTDLLIKTIEFVLAGGTYFPTKLNGSNNGKTAASPCDEPTQNPLTDRQREILTLVAQGLSNKQIAKALAVAENTVRVHVVRILKKIGAHNRAEATSKFLLGGSWHPNRKLSNLKD